MGSFTLQILRGLFFCGWVELYYITLFRIFKDFRSTSSLLLVDSYDHGADGSHFSLEVTM